MLSYKTFKGKTKNDELGVSVLEHSKNVVFVAKCLCSLYPELSFLNKYIPIVAALHDTGKISPIFGKKIYRNHYKEYLNEEYNKINEIINLDELKSQRHEEVSLYSVNNYLNTNKSVISDIVGRHHGKDHSYKNRDAWKYGKSIWENERQKFIKYMVRLFGEIPELTVDVEKYELFISGMLIICDWIGSDERFFSPLKFEGNKKHKILAENAVRNIGFKNIDIKYGLSFSEIFTGYIPNNIQKTVINRIDHRGVYILEADTGTGKTEAVLFAAYKMLEQDNGNRGIYFALPTKLTSDQIHGRMQKYVNNITNDKETVMLAHSSAWLNEEASRIIRSGIQDKKWFMPAKRTLLSNFGVGTIDQLLMSVIKVKHSFIRDYAIYNKVVIIDELHSYDIYTNTLIKLLIKKLISLRCTVIILSATLNKTLIKDILDIKKYEPVNDYPLLTTFNNHKIEQYPIVNNKKKNIKIKFSKEEDENKVIQRAINLTKSGNNVLWVVTTKNKAQELYKNIKSKTDCEVGILHSYYTVYDRKAHENSWMKKLGKNNERTIGCILVSTQVVEQSVDIDVDYLITELAPIDMLIQRAGRLWRHDKTRLLDHPTMEIITNIPENLNEFKNLIYDKFILYKTYLTLKEYDTLIVPDDLRNIIEKVYDDDVMDNKILQNWHNELIKTKIANEKMAYKNTNKYGQIIDDEKNAHTRYITYQKSDCICVKSITDKEVVFLKKDESGNNIVKKITEKFNFGLKKELYGCIVNISKDRMDKTNKMGFDKLPMNLQQYFYKGDDDIGIFELGDGTFLAEYNSKGKCIEIHYNSEIGQYIKES